MIPAGLQKKAFNTWRMHRGAKEGTDAPAVEKVEPKEEQHTEAEQSVSSCMVWFWIYM